MMQLLTIVHIICIKTIVSIFFRIHGWIGSSKEQDLFEIESFCNIKVWTFGVSTFIYFIYLI